MPLIVVHDSEILALPYSIIGIAMKWHDLSNMILEPYHIVANCPKMSGTLSQNLMLLSLPPLAPWMYGLPRWTYFLSVIMQLSIVYSCFMSLKGIGIGYIKPSHQYFDLSVPVNMLSPSQPHFR